MGTPRYPVEFSKQRRDIENKAADAFTVATKANNRPFVGPVISDASTSRWPSVTANTYADVQYATHVNSHPVFNVKIKVNAPAAGASVRVIDSASSTVLHETTGITSGLTTISTTLTLPASILYYAEFTVALQLKSTTAGQTTSGTFSMFYGSD